MSYRALPRDASRPDRWGTAAAGVDQSGGSGAAAAPRPV